jgi:hypothetical protein
MLGWNRYSPMPRSFASFPNAGEPRSDSEITDRIMRMLEENPLQASVGGFLGPNPAYPASFPGQQAMTDDVSP